MPQHPGTLRFDLLTREWVNVVGHRQDRPNLPSAGCPFCVGGLEAPEPYEVLAFTNRWPAYEPGPPLDSDAAEAAGRHELAAAGTTEVVLYSPEHHGSMATLGTRQIAKVVDLWAARTEALLARDEIAYVLVFENRGPEVGATIHHPHGQIYGYPFVPPVPRRLAEIAAVHGDPVASDLARETDSRERIVATQGAWVAYVPFAASYPYEVRIAPEHDVTRLAELDGSQRADLAAILVDVTGRYDALFPETAAREVPFPYLMWIHQAPASFAGRWPRLHVQFAPPWREAGLPRFVASGELGSGTKSNPIVPEVAAQALRAVAPRPS